MAELRAHARSSLFSCSKSRANDCAGTAPMFSCSRMCSRKCRVLCRVDIFVLFVSVSSANKL